MRYFLTLLTLAWATTAIAQQVVPPIGTSALVCAYNTSIPAPTSGNFALVQCDSTGKLITSGSSFLSTTVTLTSAQILSSFTTPVPIVPGVAGKTIYLLGADFRYNHVTTDYTSPGNGFPGIVYHGEANGFPAAPATGTLPWPSWSSSNNWAQSSNDFATNSSIDRNARIGIGLDFVTFTAAAATGDGTMNITVLYTTF